MTGLIVAAALLLAAAVVAVDRYRTARIMARLDRMVTQAMDGDFTESDFDETRLSALETRMARYLAASALSARNLRQQKEQIASKLTNLYNDVLQKQSELATAKAAYELEQTKMNAASQKLQLGTIGRLEYLQQENSLKNQEIAVKNAELALFQSMETYGWALEGNLSLT